MSVLSIKLFGPLMVQLIGSAIPNLNGTYANIKAVP